MLEFPPQEITDGRVVEKLTSPLEGEDLIHLGIPTTIIKVVSWVLSSAFLRFLLQQDDCSQTPSGFINWTWKATIPLTQAHSTWLPILNSIDMTIWSTKGGQKKFCYICKFWRVWLWDLGLHILKRWKEGKSSFSFGETYLVLNPDYPGEPTNSEIRSSFWVQI